MIDWNQRGSHKLDRHKSHERGCSMSKRVRDGRQVLAPNDLTYRSEIIEFSNS